MRPSQLLLIAVVLVHAAAQLSLDDDQPDDDEPQQRISRVSSSLRGSHMASQEDPDPLEETHPGDDAEAGVSEGSSILANEVSEAIKHEADAERVEQASVRDRRRCEDISEKVHDLEERLRSAEISEHKLRNQVELTERADEAARAICDNKINTVKKRASQRLHQYQQNHHACKAQRQRLNQTLAATVKMLAMEKDQRKRAASLVRDLTVKLNIATKVLKQEEAQLHLQNKKAKLEGHMLHVVDEKLREENASEIKFHAEAQGAEAALADAENQLAALQKQKARDATQADHDMRELETAFRQERRLHQAAQQNASSLASSLAALSQEHTQLMSKLKKTEYTLSVANKDRADLTHRLTKTEKMEEQQEQKDNLEMHRVSKELGAAQKQLAIQEARLASIQKQLEATTEEARSTKVENLDLRKSLKIAKEQSAQNLKLYKQKMDADLKALYSEASTEVEKAREKMNHEVSDTRRQLNTVETEFVAMKKMKDDDDRKLRMTTAQAKQDLTSAYKKFAEQETELKIRHRTDSKQLTEDGWQLGHLTRELAALNQSHMSEKAAMQSKLDNANQELATLREKLRAIKVHEEELHHDKELSALRQQLHGAQEENRKVRDLENEFKTKLGVAVERLQDEDKLQKQLESSREDSKKLEQEVQALSKDESSMANSLANANSSLAKKEGQINSLSAWAKKLGHELHLAQSSLMSSEHQRQTATKDELVLRAELLEQKKTKEAKDKEVNSLKTGETALKNQVRQLEAKLTMSNTEVEVLNKFKASSLKEASAAQEKLKAELRKDTSKIQKLQGEHLELLKLRADFSAVSAVAEKQAKELRKFEHFDEKLQTELGGVATMESKQAKEVRMLREIVAKAAELPAELRKKTDIGVASPAAKVSQQGIPNAAPSRPSLRKAAQMLSAHSDVERAQANPSAFAEEEVGPEEDSENDLVSEGDDSTDDAPEGPEAA